MRNREEWRYRLDMCNKLEEGCELQDAIDAITSAASILGAWEEFYSNMLLLMAENLCKEHIDYVRHGGLGWADYEELDPEMFKHFTGGAEKWTKEQWDQHYEKTD